MRIRAPAVSGSFYSDDAIHLRHFVTQALAYPPVINAHPKALIVPHAGYLYSGAAAACAYAQLRPCRDRISRVVLLGPCHRVALQGMAIPDADAFATPLGSVMLDVSQMRELTQRPGLVVSRGTSP